MSNSTCFFVPAARFCARVLKLWLRYPDRRVAERRESSGACEAPVRPARNAAGQAPDEAPRVPYGGRPPPGAPPWRFWAPVPRFPHRNCFRIGHSELLASGRSARRAGSRASRGGGPPHEPYSRRIFSCRSALLSVGEFADA